MRTKSCIACVALALAAAPCVAAASSWDGTWKLNTAKSQMTGSTVTITRNGNMYTMDAGPIKFSFACDGKDYHLVPEMAMSCTGSGHSYTLMQKVNGKVTSTTKREISADGKTLTDVTTGRRPDGATFTSHETDTRVGSGSGMEGTWRETAVKSSAPGVMVLKVNGDVLHSENPGYKQWTDAKLDGTPTKMQGANVSEEVTMWNKSEGPNKIESAVLLNGKEFGRDVMTLSADGKTITDVSWTSGKESEKQTYIYERQ